MADNNKNTPTDPQSYNSEVWENPKYVFPTPTSEHSTHSGNCHCGAIRFRFTLSPPLASYPVICCNCSICVRNGALLVYPNRDDVVLERPSAAANTTEDGEAEGEEKPFEGDLERDGEVLGGYSFGDAKVRHRFCKRCGSSVFATLVPGQWEKFFGKGAKELVPINVRMITGLDLDALALNRVDGWKMGTPKYELKD